MSCPVRPASRRHLRRSLASRRHLCRSQPRDLTAVRRPGHASTSQPPTRPAAQLCSHERECRPVWPVGGRSRPLWWPPDPPDVCWVGAHDFSVPRSVVGEHASGCHCALTWPNCRPSSSPFPHQLPSHGLGVFPLHPQDLQRNRAVKMSSQVRRPAASHSSAVWSGTVCLGGGAMLRSTCFGFYRFQLRQSHGDGFRACGSSQQTPSRVSLPGSGCSSERGGAMAPGTIVNVEAIAMRGHRTVHATPSPSPQTATRPCGGRRTPPHLARED